MADRSRRARRQISDATDDFSDDSDQGSGEDFDPRKLDSMRRAGRYDSSPASSRTRRSGGVAKSGATVQRGSSSADERRQSLKLTVKAPPSKLREVMRANEVDSLQDTLGGGKVLDGPRSTRRAAAVAKASGRGPRPKYAEYGESDIEDEEDEDEEDDEDAEEEDEEDEDTQLNDFDQVGAEPEEDSDDEDIEMEEAPLPPPTSSRRQGPQAAKPPKITLNPPTKSETRGGMKQKIVVGPVKSVEDQEMEDDADEDEVRNSSDLSDDEGEDETNLNDEDAEGEDEEVEQDADEEGVPGEDEEVAEAEEDEDDEDEDDDDMDDDSDETPASGSATPDLSKMTKRQRGRPEDQGGLLSLDMAPQQRKFFTDAEKAMKKDEHARKRKELTKRKVQEEKTAALNRLLKPQVSKARGAAPKPETLAAAAAAGGSPYDEEEIVAKANPLYTRWASTKDGIRLGVPEEWLGKNVGRAFGAPVQSSTILVQQVE